MKKIIILLLFFSFTSIYAEKEFAIGYTLNGNLALGLSDSGESIANLQGIKLEYVYKNQLYKALSFDLGATLDFMHGIHRSHFEKDKNELFLYPALLLGFSSYFDSQRTGGIIGLDMLLGLSVLGDDGSKGVTLGFRLYLSIKLFSTEKFNSHLKLGAILGFPVSSLFASISFIF